MGKVGSIIKAEIIRLTKRELRKVSVPLGKDIRSLKTMLSQMHKSVSVLERFAAQRQKESAKREMRLEAPPEEIKKARFSPRLIRSLRKKLKMTQKELAILLGVTVGAAHQWEIGKFAPKPEKKAALVALRKLGRSEVKKLLEEKGSK